MPVVQRTVLLGRWWPCTSHPCCVEERLHVTAYHANFIFRCSLLPHAPATPAQRAPSRTHCLTLAGGNIALQFSSLMHCCQVCTAVTNYRVTIRILLQPPTPCAGYTCTKGTKKDPLPVGNSVVSDIVCCDVSATGYIVLLSVV
jgi:hypothetical protein